MFKRVSIFTIAFLSIDLNTIFVQANTTAMWGRGGVALFYICIPVIINHIIGRAV